MVVKIKYLLIYLFSALTGSLVSLVFLQSNVVSVGASGAIFGLMGALLYFGYHYRVMLNNAITHTGHINIWLDFLVLIGFSMALFYICQLNIKRKWIL